MNIKILDSWLKEYLKTKATPQQIAEKLSLTSVSVERLEKLKNDFLYDIEITTNRPDLMSVIGLARETATILPQFGINAKYEKPDQSLPSISIENEQNITIKNNPKLVRQISAVIMDITVKQSPQFIKDRLEASGIRSLNNLIDITNYIMRETGHPTHVFDYDKLTTKKIIIREARIGEKITTLDGKQYTLQGGDIIADNCSGEIIDLLGIIGTANTAVTDQTKRVLFFIDNPEPHHIRKTSMNLGIRTEAAILNEKDINPLLTQSSLYQGIKLFKELADAKIISNIINITATTPKPKIIKLSLEKIANVIGTQIPESGITTILKNLEFEVKKTNPDTLEVTIPAWRASDDTSIPEDLIEEIARIYGYHNIPNSLPPIISTEITNHDQNKFYWEDHVKDALKYWGFTEIYTYPMISAKLLDENIKNVIKIANPLSEDWVYMRPSLKPSLTKVIEENPNYKCIKIFELANTYTSETNKLPNQTLILAGIIKDSKATFFHAKGIIEQLLIDLGIQNINFQNTKDTTSITQIFYNKALLGKIEILQNLIYFELNFDLLLKFVTSKKTYIPLNKFPSIIEDLALIAPSDIATDTIIATIKTQSPLIKEVTLLDKYQQTRTFHIVYQSTDRNLTDQEIGDIRTKILQTLLQKHNIKPKI